MLDVLTLPDVLLLVAVFVLAFDLGTVLGAWWAGARRATLEAQASGATTLRVMAEAECDALVWELDRERRKFGALHAENARLRREAPGRRMATP